MADGRLGLTAALVVLCLALAVRLAFVVLVAEGPADFRQPDTPAFDLPAQILAEHGLIGLPAEDGGAPVPFAERMPGYIALLAAIKVLGGGDLHVVLLQALIDAVTCLAIARLAERLRPGLGRVAGTIAAFSPILVIHAGIVLSDSLFLLPFTLFAVAAVDVIQGGRGGALVRAGLWLGLATLVRPTTWYLIWVLPVLLPAVMGGRRWLDGAKVAAVALLLVAPWIARNAHAVGAATLTDQVGVHALFWLVPLAREYGANIPMQVTQAEMRAKLDREIAAAPMPPSEQERSEIAKYIAFAELKASGVGVLAKAWAAGSVINLAAPALIAAPMVQRLDRPSFYGTAGDSVIDKIVAYFTGPGAAVFKTVVIIGLAGTGIAWLLTLAGLGGAALGGWPRAPLVLMILVTGYFLALTGPITGIKYRLPLEPFLICLMAEGVAVAWRRLRS